MADCASTTITITYTRTCLNRRDDATTIIVQSPQTFNGLAENYIARCTLEHAFFPHEFLGFFGGAHCSGKWKLSASTLKSHAKLHTRGAISFVVANKWKWIYVVYAEPRHYTTANDWCPYTLGLGKTCLLLPYFFGGKIPRTHHRRNTKNIGLSHRLSPHLWFWFLCHFTTCE